jgi:flagellar FliJ protein
MDKLLDYSTHRQKNEEQILSGMRFRHRELCRQLEELIRRRESCREDYKRKSAAGIAVKEIAVLLGYIDELNAKIKEQEKLIEISEKRMDAQVQKIVEINKENHSLEKLKEKQLEAYHVEENKENENFINEFVSNQSLKDRQ